MQSEVDPRDLIGRTLVSTDGGQIGKIQQAFVDDQSGVPEFAAVSTGLLGATEFRTARAGKLER